MSQTYDEADRIASLTYPSGEKVSYEYSDRTGLPTSLDTDEGDVIVASASYTAQGQPLTQEWGSGSANIFASWDYKADSLRLWKIKADKDSATGSDLALLRYHYDLAGNVTQFKDLKNSSQVQCFSYDDLHRLSAAFTSNDDSGNPDDCSDGYDDLGSGAYDYSWTFDQLGNVKTWTDELASNTGTYTYGAGSAGPHAATGFDGGSYGYDLNGNQTSRPNGDTLTFDQANRLASYTSTDHGTTTFTYDADGVRVVRDEGSNETVYVGGVFETSNDGDLSYYTFAGQVVAYRIEAGSDDDRYYLVSDHLGTNSHQLEYGGTNPARSSQYYYPFGGNRASSSGGLDTDRGYTGQVSDAAHTGLLFYNARYYDPQLRRFISADTIVPDPGNPQDLNRYSYVRNNPVRYSDPIKDLKNSSQVQCFVHL